MHRKDILNQAVEYVCQDRNATHGEPEDSFGRIAEYWTTYLRGIEPAAGILISSVDVALMMTLFKIARIEANCTNADSWIDAAGYLACGGGIATAIMDPVKPKDSITDDGYPSSIQDKGYGDKFKPESLAKRYLHD